MIEYDISKESVYIPGGDGRESLQVNFLSGGPYESYNETFKSWEGAYLKDNGFDSCYSERVPSGEVNAREAHQRINYQLYHLLHNAEPAVVHAMKQVIREVENRRFVDGTVTQQNVAGFMRHERGRIYIDNENEGHKVFMGETIFPEKTPVFRINDGLLSSALPTSKRLYSPQDELHEAISIPLLDLEEIQKDPDAATQGSKDITTLAGVAHVKKYLSSVLVLERSKDYHPGIAHPW